MCAWVSTKKIGHAGEVICARYLTKKGYKLISLNWYCRWGEIDIIAKEGSFVTFVEVKTVTSKRYCNAIDLFSPAKRRKLLRTIGIFALKYKISDWRLDLVCLTKTENKLWIEHYKNVLAL